MPHAVERRLPLDEERDHAIAGLIGEGIALRDIGDLRRVADRMRAAEIGPVGTPFRQSA